MNQDFWDILIKMDQGIGHPHPDIYVRSPSEDLLEGNASRTMLDERRTSLRLSSIGDAESIQSSRTDMSQTRRRPSTKKSSSTGKSSENLSLKMQRNHNTSGPNTPVIEETSFINKAAKEHNFEALKEGLGFALGTAETGANWFPVTPDPKSGSEKNQNGSLDNLSQDLTSATDEGYTDTIQLDNLSTGRINNPFNRDTNKSAYLSPFDDPTHYQPDYGPTTPTSDVAFSFNDTANPDLLEAGHLTPTSGSAPPHSKISNVLTRLSDRIAGNRTGTSPTTTSPSKSPRRLSTYSEGESPVSPMRMTLFSQHGSDSASNNNGSDLASNNNNGSDNASNAPHYLPDVTVTDEFQNENYLQGTNASEGLGLFLNKDSYLSTDSLRNNNPQPSPVTSSHKPILLQLSPEKLDTENNDLREPIKKGTFTDTRTMYFFGKSLKLFSPQSSVRLLCHRILSHRSTNSLLLVLLVLQTALLSYRQWNPMHLGGYYYAGYNWADYILIVINIIYTIEVFAKIIAYGFIDDRAMFKELGLLYPENDVKILYFNLKYIKGFLRILGLLKFAAKRSGNKNIPPQHMKNSFDGLNDSSDDIDVKEINLGEDAPTNTDQPEHKISNPFVDPSMNIQKKYSDTNLHNETSTNILEEHDSDSLDLVDEPVLDSQKFDVKNTLLLSKPRGRNIDQLHLKRAFLRNSWHRIDFLSMVFFWISLFLSINEYDSKHHIMLFRALSCLRILRLCNLTTGTTTILTACKVAIPQLIDVSIFICCFWLFFGIIGVQSFKSSFTRQCVWFNPDDSNDTYINEGQYCGSYIDLDGKAMPYILRDGLHSSTKKGFTCPKYSKCISDKNPYGGTVNFDNILQSMELVFVIMSANTFTDLMYDTMNSDNMAACLFFIFAIFILTVWLINVFVAVIVASFTITRREAAEEKKQQNNGKRTWKIFGSANQDVSLHTERLNLLKKQNVFLKYYYKFEFIFVILIFVSLFVQCFRDFNMSNNMRHVLYRFEASITGILLAEIVLRLGFHFPNWRLFFISRRNCYDLFLAVITTIIIIGPIKEKLGHAYYWLTIFQLLRFYRVVLATNITRKLWLKIMGNFKAIFDLTLFFFILTFLASIITSRFFEGTIPKDELDDIDFPMHTLPNAFIALYVITSTENWTEILYALQEFSSTTSSRAFGAMLLIGWFIISNMVILNIFIAVIARTLEVSEEGKRKQQLIQFIDNMTERLQNLENEPGMLAKMKNKVFGKRGVKHELEKAVVNLLLSGTAVNDFLETEANDNDVNDDTEIKNLPNSSWKRWFQVNYWRTKSFFRNPFYASKSKKPEITNFDPAHFAQNIISERNILISKQNKFLKENPKFNNVFYVMGPRHRLRRMCQRLVKSSYGERIDGVEPNKTVSETFIVVMFLSTIGLVVTACYLTPLFRKEMVSKYGYMNFTFFLEIGFVALFTIEFFIRIIADGLIFTPNAYLRSSWNFIDVIVLISLWIEFIATLKNDGNLSRIVRGLKALRALRLLTISETAKNNFHNTIISGFWKIINAAIISLCLLFPFAIWGLNIFNGRLGYCIDGESYESGCIHEYENQVFNWNVMSPNVYTNPYLDFDDFGTSFSSLFQIISLEGWVDLLLDVMKSTGVGTPPEDFASPFNGFFVVLFNFTSIVFILTLFVSVIISNYSKTTGRAYMTKDQISWYQVKKFLVQVRPSKRKDFNLLSFFQKFCYSMTVERNTYWHETLNFVLLMHVLALLLECFPSYDGLDTFRAVIYMMTALLFLINALMLFIGQGARTFIRYKWNIFNLFISSGAFLTTIIAFFVSSENAFLNFNKLFLVGILTFIIPRSNRLSELLRFASASLPTLLSLSFTWIIVFLVFAIAMNQIFGLTKVGPNTSNNINLRSVPKALILLFRCSFGEGWNFIMDDFALTEPYCSSIDSIDDNDCGSRQYAYILFMLWNVVSMYIFLNMFVSLIIDSFSYINNRSSYSHLIKREEIRKFKRAWQKFDPEGSGYIRPFDLPKFLHSLDGALAFHFYSGSLEIPVLCRQWFKRNQKDDPYDITVNYKAIDQTLSLMDVPRIRERRKAYERFMEEAIMNMELNGDPGISFTRIILQLPLYTSFEAGQCLNLIDFLDRRLLVQKVEKRLHTKRVYETIASYACRWKYVNNRNQGIRDTNIDFSKGIKRKSYLANENLEVNAPSIFVTDTNDSYDSFEKEEDETFPLTKSAGYMEEDDNENGGTTSGVYVPKSPLHIYNSRNRAHNHESPEKKSKSQTPPKLYIQIPSSHMRSGGTSPTSPVDDAINISPFLNSAKIDDDTLTEANVSLIDLSNLGETLENSQWGDAFREVQSDRKTENNKDANKEE